MKVKRVFTGFLCIQTFLILLIIGNNIFANEDYLFKKEFIMPNGILLILGISFLFALLFIISKIADRWNVGKSKIMIATLILFVLQSFIFYNICFLTKTWDPGLIIRNAKMISQGDTAGLDNLYFSWFPNNHLIVIIYSYLFKIANAFGLFKRDEGLFLIVMFQCLLSSLTGLIIYNFISKSTGSEKAAWFGWTVFVILIGLSGWNVVTYSDMLGIIFPVLIAWVYQNMKNGGNVYVDWFLIISLSYVGWKIKPTIVIVLIAIIIVEIFSLIAEFEKALLQELMIIGVIGVISVALYMFIFGELLNHTGFVIDKEANAGVLYTVVTGLNPETDGVWNENDATMSLNIQSKSERQEMQKAVIKQRMQEYTIASFLKHLQRKALVNFNDGSFAFGDEGGFYDILYGNQENKIVSTLMHLYYSYGRYYKYVLVFLQMVWLSVLLLSAGIVFADRNKENTVISLSITGIILFNMIFEARARYIIVYVPFFIIAAGLVMNEILRKKSL